MIVRRAHDEAVRVIRLEARLDQADRELLHAAGAVSALAARTAVRRAGRPRTPEQPGPRRSCPATIRSHRSWDYRDHEVAGRVRSWKTVRRSRAFHRARPVGRRRPPGNAAPRDVHKKAVAAEEHHAARPEADVVFLCDEPLRTMPSTPLLDLPSGVRRTAAPSRRRRRPCARRIAWPSRGQ